ncbi:MAG: metal-sensitive transcriptional regulator [Bacillota bacterium]
MRTLQDEARTSIINRLKRIEGQVRGMTRMVVEDQDCEKILDQFKALDAAVRNCSKVLIGYYIMRCIQEKVVSDEDAISCIRKKLSAILNTHLL